MTRLRRLVALAGGWLAIAAYCLVCLIDSTDRHRKSKP